MKQPAPQSKAEAGCGQLQWSAPSEAKAAPRKARRQRQVQPGVRSLPPSRLGDISVSKLRLRLWKWLPWVPPAAECWCFTVRRSSASSLHAQAWPEVRLREVPESQQLLASWLQKTRPVRPLQALLPAQLGLHTRPFQGTAGSSPGSPSRSLGTCHFLPVFTDTNHLPCNRTT